MPSLGEILKGAYDEDSKSVSLNEFLAENSDSNDGTLEILDESKDDEKDLESAFENAKVDSVVDSIKKESEETEKEQSKKAKKTKENDKYELLEKHELFKPSDLITKYYDWKRDDKGNLRIYNKEKDRFGDKISENIRIITPQFLEALGFEIKDVTLVTKNTYCIIASKDNQQIIAFDNFCLIHTGCVVKGEKVLPFKHSKTSFKKVIDFIS